MRLKTKKIKKHLLHHKDLLEDQLSARVLLFLDELVYEDFFQKKEISVFELIVRGLLKLETFPSSSAKFRRPTLFLMILFVV